MHFDTEEATLQLTGEVVHPTVSSVLYLSGAAAPTVVFDQRADDDAPAAHAHVSHPVEGRRPPLPRRPPALRLPGGAAAPGAAATTTTRRRRRRSATPAMRRSG